MGFSPRLAGVCKQVGCSSQLSFHPPEVWGFLESAQRQSKLLEHDCVYPLSPLRSQSPRAVGRAQLCSLLLTAHCSHPISLLGPSPSRWKEPAAPGLAEMHR